MSRRVKVTTWFDEGALMKAATAGANRALGKCALAVGTTAKRLLNVGGGKPHRASLPWQPPHKLTSTLFNSIQCAPYESWASGRISWLIGPTTVAWYGRIHEFGARGPITVTPKMRGFLRWKFGWNLRKDTTTITIGKRPFMRPALMITQYKFPQLFANILYSVEQRTGAPPGK